MRYIAVVDGKTYNIDVEGDNGGLRASIDGQPVGVDLRQVTGATLFSLIKDGLSYEVFSEPMDKGYAIIIGSERFAVQVADERSLRLAQVQKRVVERRGDMIVKAPMPGLVIDVRVKVGDVVEAGQSLLTLSAMKMENDLRAFEGGTVKTVNVQKGDKVEQGQALLVVG